MHIGLPQQRKIERIELCPRTAKWASITDIRALIPEQHHIKFPKQVQNTLVWETI